MQNAGAFQCPHCAAPVQFQFGQHAVECEYCGSTVIVPPELQPPPPPQQPLYQQSQVQIFINGDNVYAEQGQTQTQRHYTPQVSTAAPARKGSCAGVLIFVVALMIIMGAIVGVLGASSPFFFDNLLGGGFARLEQTYGSDEATATKGTALGTVDDPVDVAVDPDGNVYVATYSGEVVRFSPDGAPLGQWRIPSDDAHPDSIAVDGAGNVFLTYGTAIHKLQGDTGGEISTITVSDIFGVSDLAIAPDGTMLSFVGGQTDEIIRFDPTGAEVARYVHPISEYDPEAPLAPWLIRIAADSEGRIYLMHMATGKPAVSVYSADGKRIMQFGKNGSGEGELNSPGAIAVDSKGRIYVSNSNDVLVYDSDGNYEGIIRMPFSYRAGGLAFDKSDRLYVVARNENKVYRFVLNAP